LRARKIPALQQLADLSAIQMAIFEAVVSVGGESSRKRRAQDRTGAHRRPGKGPRTMTAGDAQRAARPDGDGDVRIRIRPNRSLSPKAILPLFCAAAAVLVTIGIGFTLLGAWPVLPFAGLEIVMIGAVLRWMHRHHDDYELVIVAGDRVRVIRRSGQQEREAEFNRHWARVSMTPPGSARHSMQVRVGSHGRYVEIGAAVREEDRRRLADEIKSALARVQ